jgi:hypothetical protein
MTALRVTGSAFSLNLSQNGIAVSTRRDDADIKLHFRD